MSAEELFLGNFCAGCLLFSVFVFLHFRFVSFLVHYMKNKKKVPDFEPPAVLNFPAPGIILFMMYYNGTLQSSLVIMVAPCVGSGWRAFGGLVCAGIIGVIILLMMRMRRFHAGGHVHGGKSGFNSEKGSSDVNSHFEFEHKYENGHKTVGRFKRALTQEGMGKNGNWKPKSDETKTTMASLDTLFKKFGATGVMFYFLNVLRKTIFTIFLTIVPQVASEKQSGPVQLFLSLIVALGEFGYILTHLPYLKMADNLNEMNVLATQIGVLVPPVLGFLGILSWEDVQMAMSTLSFASIG